MTTSRFHRQTGGQGSPAHPSYLCTFGSIHVTQTPPFRKTGDRTNSGWPCVPVAVFLLKNILPPCTTLDPVSDHGWPELFMDLSSQTRVIIYCWRLVCPAGPLGHLDPSPAFSVTSLYSCSSYSSPFSSLPLLFSCFSPLSSPLLSSSLLFLILAMLRDGCFEEAAGAAPRGARLEDRASTSFASKKVPACPARPAAPVLKRRALPEYQNTTSFGGLMNHGSHCWFSGLYETLDTVQIEGLAPLAPEEPPADPEELPPQPPEELPAPQPPEELPPTPQDLDGEQEPPEELPPPPAEELPPEPQDLDGEQERDSEDARKH